MVGFAWNAACLPQASLAWGIRGRETAPRLQENAAP